MTSNKYLVLSAVLAFSSCASAFFLGWGSSEQRTPAPQYYYHKRLVQGPVQTYSLAGNERQQIPAVPIQVPLQAQLAPLPNVHNVQLVPCLCPVSPDFSYDNQAHPESVYVNAVPLQHIQQQQIQQQQQPNQ